MLIDELRAEVEEQERRVMALRKRKECRDALLHQVRLLMSSSEPELFAALGSEARELMLTLEESAARQLSPTLNMLSPPTQVSDGTMPLFRKEMEERIAEEEEPPLQEQQLQTYGNNRRRNRKRKKQKQKVALLENPHDTALSKLEVHALMVAVDALELEHTPHIQDAVPIWLEDFETPEEHHDEQLPKEGNEGGEENYSDDFEELSDLDRSSEVIEKP